METEKEHTSVPNDTDFEEDWEDVRRRWRKARERGRMRGEVGGRKDREARTLKTHISMCDASRRPNHVVQAYFLPIEE